MPTHWASSLPDQASGSRRFCGACPDLRSRSCRRPRARSATAELVLEAVNDPPELRLEEGLYQADPNDVLGYLQGLSDEVTAAMVVGHNPTAHALSQGLIRAGDKKGHSLAVRAGFPTCALGVYSFKVETWSDVAAHGAKLVALLTPPFGGEE